MAKASKIAVSSVESWSKTITTTWVKSARAIIETGRQLSQAEEALSRADFAGLIGRPGVRGRLPFSYDTARRLMTIGADERLGRLLAHGPNLLPASWRTLHELTRLTDEQFKRALEEGLISSDMERYEVDHIRQGVYSTPESEPPPASPEPVTVRVHSSARRIDDPALRSWKQEITPPDPVGNVVPLDLPHSRSIDHFGALKLAWDAASEADRVAFLNYIGARRIN